MVLEKSDVPTRKTAYDLIAVYKQNLGWVNIDSQVPNKVVKEWLESGQSMFGEVDYLKPEYTYGKSRIDFYIECGERKIFIEVKGCTLEIDGEGYFPDAPTERGVKHLKELTAAVGAGYECYILFVIAMPGVSTVHPNRSTHPQFADEYEKAVAAGVKPIMLQCDVKTDEIKYCMNDDRVVAHYHLPGLFEFYEFYKVFLPLYYSHREYFYDWCDIGSIYGAPQDCIWGGGRVENEGGDPASVLDLLKKFGISARLTFSNSLLTQGHLSDKHCNSLCRLFENCDGMDNGVIVHSDLLMKYLKDNYPGLYLISSTTKVLTDFEELVSEIDREEFGFVVPDFRLNKKLDLLSQLRPEQKNKVEFLCNECCSFGCQDRKVCYEDVSRKNLGIDSNHRCRASESQEGYRFSKAMKNPGFIGVEDIVNTYIPMGFSNYKIEGRGLGSALILEFILYYMTKPEYQLHVREEIYLDNMLDLF